MAFTGPPESVSPQYPVGEHTMRTLVSTTALTLILAASSSSAQVINIPPDAFPAESFFAANPGTIVNVDSGGAISPDNSMPSAFNFNGATVNINSGGASGFPVFDTFIENVTYNVNTNGDLTRTKFVGSTGTTNVNIDGGETIRGVWLQGNTAGTLNSGDMGRVAGGQAAVITEDTATFTMNGGDIDTFIIFNDTAVFTQTGGTIAGSIQMNDDAIANISGGSSGTNGFLAGEDNILNLSGGTIGRDFVVRTGVLNMSGGGMDVNCAILASGGPDPEFNMTGGALGSDFRAYDGTFNLSGGLVGNGFRLGTPTGDGSGVTMNIVCKSATLDTVPLMLSTTPATITTRGGALLVCVLLDDSLVSFDLNEDTVFGEDRFRAAATLTIALETPSVCVGDIADDFGTLGGDGMVSFGDFLALLGLIGPCPGGTPGCTGDIADDFGTLGGDGMVSFGDFLALLGLIGPCP